MSQRERNEERSGFDDAMEALQIQGQKLNDEIEELREKQSVKRALKRLFSWAVRLTPVRLLIAGWAVAITGGPIILADLDALETLEDERLEEIANECFYGDDYEQCLTKTFEGISTPVLGLETGPYTVKAGDVSTGPSFSVNGRKDSENLYFTGDVCRYTPLAIVSQDSEGNDVTHRSTTYRNCFSLSEEIIMHENIPFQSCLAGSEENCSEPLSYVFVRTADTRDDMTIESRQSADGTIYAVRCYTADIELRTVPEEGAGEVVSHGVYTICM